MAVWGLRPVLALEMPMAIHVQHTWLGIRVLTSTGLVPRTLDPRDCHMCADVGIGPSGIEINRKS